MSEEKNNTGPEKAEYDDQTHNTTLYNNMPSNNSLPGACRVQSPSSILTYKQCPRKYYYRYIARLPGKKSIHLVRGSIIHKVLEEIYDLDLDRMPNKRFSYALSVVLHEAFRKAWAEASDELAELDISPEDLEFYFEESKLMIENFFHYLYDKMRPFLKSMSEKEAFSKIKPQREVFMSSPQHLVRGYIDVIQEEDGIDGRDTVIIDYKTSKKLEITPEYQLQLGIYAMMHEEKRKRPDMVGILFLKHGKELRIPVTDEMIRNAQNECLNIQLKTRSKEINDYPKVPSPLCKWSTGQCDYYDLCFKGLSIDDYKAKISFKRE